MKIEMKQRINNVLYVLALALIWTGCKDDNYPGGSVSPYIPIYDLRSLYKGTELTLSSEKMFGSSKISGIVISDHSGGNMPADFLVIQDKRRLGELRGISIKIGPEAKNYISGDSVLVTIDGAILNRVDGLLQLLNVPASAVTKVSSGNEIPPNRVPSSYILADPSKYESTLVAIVKGGFDPIPSPSDTYSGEKTLNDGFSDITLHTEASATFARNSGLPFNANYYGIIFTKADANGKLIPQHRLRTEKDIVPLSSEPEIAPIIISGFINDPEGTDANNEYIQFLATTNIDFSQRPFSVVTTNNAGASVPTGFPQNGWATGGTRTHKFNITSGTVAKGSFFYVGGTNKLINSTGSTSISSANWVKSRNYGTTAGEGFGDVTTNLLANSGNAFGIAAFEGTTVTANTKPIDVIFIGSGGSIFSAATSQGYRIANTDFYDVIDPISLSLQPFYRSGTNTISLSYATPTNSGLYYKLGGVYNENLGKWVKARTQFIHPLTKQSTLIDIEGPSIVTVSDAGTGAFIRTDTISVTKLKDRQN